MRGITPSSNRTKFLTEFEEQTPDTDQTTEETSELVIPEDVSEMGSEDLSNLREQAVEAFNSIYGDGENVSSDDLETLNTLAQGIDRLDGEISEREEAAQKRTADAEALAVKVNGETVAEGDVKDVSVTTDEDEGGDEEASTEETEEAASEEDEDESEMSSQGKKEIRMSLSNIRKRQAKNGPKKTETPAPSIKDVAFAAHGVPNFGAGQGMTIEDMAQAISSRVGSFSPAEYESAARSGRRLHNVNGLSTIKKPFSKDLTITSDSPEEAYGVMARAADEKRLEGNSLVASGGWCAPSETVYDLYEAESRDGLLSIPEIQVNRGGIRYPVGPHFSDIFGSDAFFHYTEQEDIDGDYDGEGGGKKPVLTVDCPDFEDVRLEPDGVIVQAGLLKQRGFPEVIARTIRGALVAHDHKVNGRVISNLVNGSDAVTMRSGTVGTTAPLLTAIELQAEHLKYSGMLGRGTTLEGVFPYWVRGAVRSDLALRLGVDMIDVPDSRIDGWFRDRGINAQYVYDWQSIASQDASDFTAWPDTVKFLMYPAGTWIKGVAPILTLNTLYDSELLRQNDYTALFTEESYLTTKFGGESRVIEVPLSASGMTGGGVEIDRDGTQVSAPADDGGSGE